ncbi:uncharacterized protein M437DRAFT_62977 [Aureobasidium melanogenum CBS 110374]|uniref:Uncharacterized protein n=1 Tax=Aureobasidium melanogenum (strain CBS 110374) TaxID=1043003 RepID=A0A074WWP8_AURM1|nr:uncharacterized protein M437DRAFT_62977 [Aureobasidium melanogenum CBS 110374]KEQ66806.1 hypothetical protein M437DRAFT_62977 [Aureobasidium melanogenum CBS 110374]
MYDILDCTAYDGQTQDTAKVKEFPLLSSYGTDVLWLKAYITVMHVDQGLYLWTVYLRSQPRITQEKGFGLRRIISDAENTPLCVSPPPELLCPNELRAQSTRHVVDRRRGLRVPITPPCLCNRTEGVVYVTIVRKQRRSVDTILTHKILRTILESRTLRYRE